MKQEVKEKIKELVEGFLEDRVENPIGYVEVNGKTVPYWTYIDIKNFYKPFELNWYEIEVILEKVGYLDKKDNDDYEEILECIKDYQKMLSPVTKESWNFRDAFGGTIFFYTTADITDEEWENVCEVLTKKYCNF